MRLVTWTLSEHGRALGAMETIAVAMVWRGKIQEESLYYDAFDRGRKKHDGSLPLVGVNTFLPKEHAGEIATEIELIRSTPEEKAAQIDHVELFQQLRNALEPSPASGKGQGEGALGLAYLQQTARDRQNVFAALMEAVGA